jgi:hypothetical protein
VFLGHQSLVLLSRTLRPTLKSCQSQWRVAARTENGDGFGKRQEQGPRDGRLGAQPQQGQSNFVDRGGFLGQTSATASAGMGRTINRVKVGRTSIEAARSGRHTGRGCFGYSVCDRFSYRKVESNPVMATLGSAPADAVAQAVALLTQVISLPQPVVDQGKAESSGQAKKGHVGSCGDKLALQQIDGPLKPVIKEGKSPYCYRCITRVILCKRARHTRF